MRTKTVFFALSAFALTAVSACKSDSTSEPDKTVPTITLDWPSTQPYHLGDSIKWSPIVSPSDGATYKWTLDGQTIATTKDLAYKLTEALINVELKFEVTRNEVSNSRQATVLVVNAYQPKTYTYKKVAWLGTDGAVEDVPWADITHLIVTSAVVKAWDTIAYEPVANLNIPLLRTLAHHHGVKLMLAISGSIVPINAVHSYGNLNFYDAAVGTHQSNLIASIVKIMKDNHFDGIDVYMDKPQDAAEYPAATLANLVTFFSDLATAVKASKNSVESKEYDYVLSMSINFGYNAAMAIGTPKIQNTEGYDWVNLLVFGMESLTPAPHSVLEQDDAEGNETWVRQEVGRWTPSPWFTDPITLDRIVVVCPAFGLRYFGNVADYGWGNLWELTEYIPYRALCTTYPNAPAVNYQNVDNGLWYDGIPAITDKATYVKDNTFGGMGLWSVESDSKDPAKSLMHKISTELGN
ncbi:hypothetical protein FACS1894156_0250 [Bacteroidia bacterium]|nr:hypothetical protein FACS1894156_0250 [Bacteroidia bacterium]